MLVGEFPGRYETIFILILIFEDIIYHHFMMCVVGRVSMFLKLFLQVLSHLWRTQNNNDIYRLQYNICIYTLNTKTVTTAA